MLINKYGLKKHGYYFPSRPEIISCYLLPDDNIQEAFYDFTNYVNNYCISKHLCLVENEYFGIQPIYDDDTDELVLLGYIAYLESINEHNDKVNKEVTNYYS